MWQRNAFRAEDRLEETLLQNVLDNVKKSTVMISENTAETHMGKVYVQCSLPDLLCWI